MSACAHRWAATDAGWKRCIRCLETRTTDGDDQAAIVAQWNRKLAGDGTPVVRTKQVFKSKRRQWQARQQQSTRGRRATPPPVEVRTMSPEERWH